MTSERSPLPVPITPTEPLRFFRLREFESAIIPRDLIAEEHGIRANSFLLNRDFFRTSLTTQGFRVQASGWIGVLPINDRLTIEVIPRVPLMNLGQILRIAETEIEAIHESLRNYDTDRDSPPSMIPVYAYALRSEVEKVVAKGLHKEYRRIDEATSHPSGHLSMHRTVDLRARGIRHKLGVSRFHRSHDTDVNRCLRFAVASLASLAGRADTAISIADRRAALRDLNVTDHLLDGVTIDHSMRFLDDPHVSGRQPLPEHRLYYQPAISLAAHILQDRFVHLEDAATGVYLPLLLVNMSAAFEGFVRRTLMRRHTTGQPLRVLDGNLQPPAGGAHVLFERGERVNATPDIVIRESNSGRCALVIEAKYKPAGNRPDRDDLNQAIAYAVAYQAPAVVLVQPCSEGATSDRLRLVGEVQGFSVYMYHFDLGASDLSKEEEIWVDEMTKLAERSVAVA